jgi:glycosyltransferase involved in cell wall biosynthesis
MSFKTAVVTPYYQESREVLERCIDSVRHQSSNTDHILIADGHPQDWLDSAGVRHLRLDRAHADYGNTPRGIGALLAAAEGYSAIALLDADNWLDPAHVETCLDSARSSSSPDCDYVVARRHLCRPDGSVLNYPETPPSDFVDTNCFFFLRGAFGALATWALIPRELSVIGDRLFSASLRARKLRFVVTPRQTVSYLCLWPAVYRALGETPPPDAKAGIDLQPVHRWLGSLSDDELRTISRQIGVIIQRPVAA